MPFNSQHIAPQGGGFEPQRSFNFQLELYGVPGRDIINMSVIESFLPEINIEQIEVPYMAEVRKVAGKVRYQDGQVVCADYVDRPTFSSIEQWRKMVYDPASGLLSYASNYKKEGAIVMVGPDGSASRIYKIKGAWPSVVSGGPMSMENSDFNRINLTITFDVAEPNF